MDYIIEIISCCPLENWNSIIDAFHIGCLTTLEIIDRLSWPLVGKIIRLNDHYIFVYKTDNEILPVIELNNAAKHFYNNLPNIYKYVYRTFASTNENIEVKQFVQNKEIKKMIILEDHIIAPAHRKNPEAT